MKLFTTLISSQLLLASISLALPAANSEGAISLRSRADLDPDQVNVKCAEKVKRAASAAAAAASAYEAIADGPLASRDLNALLTRDNGADVYVAKAKRAAEAAAAAAEEANEAIAAEIEIKKL